MCEGPNIPFLLVERIDSLVFEMAMRRMRFSKFNCVSKTGACERRACLCGMPSTESEVRCAIWTALTVREKAQSAYEDIGAVTEAAYKAWLARKVARLVPRVCIKG